MTMRICNTMNLKIYLVATLFLQEEKEIYRIWA